MFRRGLMKFVDREPVAAVSLGLGLFGFSLPLIVPPIRQSMGLCTKQACVRAGVLGLLYVAHTYHPYIRCVHIKFTPVFRRCLMFVAVWLCVLQWPIASQGSADPSISARL